MCTTDLSGALVAAGWSVMLHSNLFPGQGEKPDHDWIPVVTELGYAILTSDKKMKSWKTEQMQARQAIEDHSAKVFFLRGTGLKPEDQANAVIAAARSMGQQCKKYRGTFLIARIHTNGSSLGRVDVQYYGKGSKTEQKYGARLKPQQPA
jgi:hypothetical protein